LNIMIEIGKVKRNSPGTGKATMILSFHPCLVTDYQIILGDRTLEVGDFELIEKADVIILPQGCAYGLYQAAKESSALIFPNYDARFAYPGKTGQSELFMKADCPRPATTAWQSVEHFRRRISESGQGPHNYPFLIKTSYSHEGKGVFFISNRSSLEVALDKVAVSEKTGRSGFVSQEMVASEGNVLRAVILGTEIITYWKRPQNPGQVITTISSGADIDKTWRKDLQEKGRKEAARFCTRTGINLAAIDFVFALDAPDPSPLFLEINYFFGRRGLGGTLRYYGLLYRAVQKWIEDRGLDPSAVTLF